jgi:ribosomal protein S8
MLNTSNFFSLVKLGYLSKKNIIQIKRTKFHLLLLKKLYILGYIRGFNLNSESLYKFDLFLKYYKNKPLIKDVNFVISTSKVFHSKVKKIKKQLAYSYLLVVFSTSKGLLTSIECVIYNTGGILAFIF